MKATKKVKKKATSTKLDTTVKVCLEYTDEQQAIRALKADDLYNVIWNFIHTNLSDHREEETTISKMREEIFEELNAYDINIYTI